jgi:CRISPR-associated endonuclease/helicase Cas3
MPPRPGPYEEVDVAASASALAELEGQGVSPEGLGGQVVAVKEVVHPVLRRRDLVGLFDTAPDLSGNDLDVGRFIRAANDLDVQVAWRMFPSRGPAADEPSPTRRELCPVPISELREELKRRRSVWRFDHLAEAWVPCTAGELHPGAVLLLAADKGGYEPTTGWNPASRSAVAPVSSEAPSPVMAADEATGSDPASYAPGRWVTLRKHLKDVEAAVRELTAELVPTGLSAGQIEAAAVAGRLHDWGKVHPVFQDTLRRSAKGPQTVVKPRRTDRGRSLPRRGPATTASISVTSSPRPWQSMQPHRRY